MQDYIHRHSGDLAGLVQTFSSDFVASCLIPSIHHKQTMLSRSIVGQVGPLKSRYDTLACDTKEFQTPTLVYMYDTQALQSSVSMTAHRD